MNLCWWTVNSAVLHIFDLIFDFLNMEGHLFFNYCENDWSLPELTNTVSVNYILWQIHGVNS